jgi:glutamate synthase domain-containing protein 3
MSGGIAYVRDVDGRFASRHNGELVELEELTEEDEERVRALIAEHLERTGSALAAQILADWETELPRFVKVMPRDYKRVLIERHASTGGEGFVTTEIEAEPAEDESLVEEAA